MTKKKGKKVIIAVRGGVADVALVPPGVVVEIRDYDVDGADEDRLKKDSDGELYLEGIYESDAG